MSTELDQAIKRAEAAESLVAELREALKSVSAIMSDSRGVAGYHLNGDIYGWDEGDPPLRSEVEAALTKTPADMGAELTRLREEVITLVGTLHLTNEDAKKAEARVAELEAQNPNH